MRLGLHIDPPLAAIPAQLAAAGLDVFQTTLRDPHRFGNHGVPDEEDQAAFRAAAGAKPPWGMVHASLLTNLASPDGRIRNASVSSLVGDLRLARALGLAGVCFHVGYARGHRDQDSALAAASRKLAQVLERAPEGARPLLENACEGSELAKTIAELGRLVRDAAVPPERLGVVVDTCHLHAAGFDLAEPEAGDRLAEALAAEGLLERLVALHLNDCQGPCGCGRDRHAAPGEGSIGPGLRAIVRHRAFRHLPAVLEVPADAARRGVAYLDEQD